MKREEEREGKRRRRRNRRWRERERERREEAEEEEVFLKLYSHRCMHLSVQEYAASSTYCGFV